MGAVRTRGWFVQEHNRRVTHETDGNTQPDHADANVHPHVWRNVTASGLAALRWAGNSPPLHASRERPRRLVTHIKAAIQGRGLRRVAQHSRGQPRLASGASPATATVVQCRTHSLTSWRKRSHMKSMRSLATPLNLAKMRRCSTGVRSPHSRSCWCERQAGAVVVNAAGKHGQWVRSGSERRGGGEGTPRTRHTYLWTHSHELLHFACVTVHAVPAHVGVASGRRDVAGDHLRSTPTTPPR